MKSYSALIIIVLLNFYPPLYKTANAQCGQQIAVTDLKISAQNQTGSFKLNVRSGNDYQGELVKIDGTEELTVESFGSGNGAQHRFSGLDVSGDVFYRVVLAFRAEERFLCKRKVVDVEFDNLR